MDGTTRQATNTGTLVAGAIPAQQEQPHECEK